MDNILSIKGLSKRYGNVEALRGLDLEIQKGQVFGILGPNGSGKTTTLGIALGVIIPDRGRYSWFGRGTGSALRRRIGALLEKPNFYPHLSATDNLKLAADIKGTSYRDIPEKLEMAGILPYADRKFRAFSTGMKQRLAIASAMLGNPEVLVLDEPTNGLDPEGIADVRKMIKGASEQGTTIILASHLLDEVQKVCTHVVVLKSGRRIFNGAVADLLLGSERLEVGSDDPVKLKKVLLEHPAVKSMDEENEMLLVELEEGYKAGEISAYLIKHGVNITHLSRRSGSLESEFLALLTAEK
jgi:ABC-2 type transport system ATP-binding protein